MIGLSLAATVGGGGGAVGRAIQRLPLTHSLIGEAGQSLTFARAGASAVVDCYDTLQIVRSNEPRFWGARRVENKVTDDSFASGWTLGSNVTKTLETTPGPYNGRQNVYRFARTSTNGIILTYNSASYRPGQWTYSAWADGWAGTSTTTPGSPTAITVTIQWIRSADSVVVASETITLGTSDLGKRICCAFEVPDTQNYRVSITSATVSLMLRLSCAQVEWTHGQSGAPNDYVPRGNAADAFPYRGANVDGVEYFDTFNGWTEVDGVATEGEALPIDAADLKGHLVGPTRVNKFYESRDIGAASWTLTNATAAGAMIASTLLGPSSLRKLEETTANGLHRATQVWRNATLPDDDVMITMSAYVPPTVAERAIAVIGFKDKAGVEKKAYINVSTLAKLTESGATDPSAATGHDNQPWYQTHITPIGDLVRLSFTSTAGEGVGVPEGFVGLASADGVESYAGTTGSGMYFGALSFERTDHACIYLGDTATSAPAGTGDDTNSLRWSPQRSWYDWTVTVDMTPMFDTTSYTKSSWTYTWYDTELSNLRWGCGIRPGSYGGAIVEEFVRHPVFDCYAGVNGTGVPQVNPNTGLPQEIFDVANLQLFDSALTTRRWQIALHPKQYDGLSNIAMYIGSTQGELDFNGTNVVSKVPVGTSGLRLGYKLVPIDEKCIKNFTVINRARTWAEMAADAT